MDCSPCNSSKACVLILPFSVLAMLFLSLSSSSNFTELFQASWAPDHIVMMEGDQLVKLTLDSISGCGFESKSKYLFGKVSMQIKLVEGDSAGTVTAFYMASEGPNHDELDFEFLGNVSGQPYLVQTNVYVNGTGDREQRHSLWFDPAKDFHTYSFLWNPRYIAFLVDKIPIRVFANRDEIGVPYPKEQVMGIHGSFWNADDWATQGGSVKTNWSNAPFIASFQSFDIDACPSSPDGEETAVKCSRTGHFWWDKPAMSGLNKHETHQLKWVRAKHLVYDYCKDTERFRELPRECFM